MILLVEDKDSLRLMLRRTLEVRGHAVIEARDQAEAERALLEDGPEMVISDLRLTRGDGFGVLRAAKRADPDLPVVVMTAFGSIQEAVAAMKEGALDFLQKPIDPDHLALLVERALDRRRLVAENLLLKEELAARRGAPRIVGESAALKQVLGALHRASSSDVTVLLLGESGTGKELFARSLHALSDRSRGPFVAINCAAIPAGLLESELFGYEKGAFTGAVARKPGKFELANRGTLFLDEIGDLPIALQAKILRVLDDRRVERVGGTSALQVNVRLVAATNQDLRAKVASRAFREDLFFRLAVYPITVPPLRARPEDVPLLANHFIERYCREMRKPPLSLSPEAARMLAAYDWPGNVRELQNAIERAVILADGDTLLPAYLNLPTVAQQPAAGGESPRRDGVERIAVDLSGSLADILTKAQGEIERRAMAAALSRAGGDEALAAEVLGLPLEVFRSKLQAL
ncbi:MAG: sigma-54-dependent transcriptional regulator [Vicinamibacterales bacterium]